MKKEKETPWDQVKFYVVRSVVVSDDGESIEVISDETYHDFKQAVEDVKNLADVSKAAYNAVKGYARTRVNVGRLAVAAPRIEVLHVVGDIIVWRLVLNPVDTPVGNDLYGLKP